MPTEERISDEIQFILSVKLVQYIPLEEREAFNLEIAQNYMKNLERNARRPKSLRTKLYVYNHGLELDTGSWKYNHKEEGKEKNESYVSFHQIKKYITFRSRMQILLLGIVRDPRYDRGFMFLFTKSVDDTKRLCDAIEQAENVDLQMRSSPQIDNVSMLSLSPVVVNGSSRMSNESNASSGDYNQRLLKYSVDDYSSQSAAEDSPWEVDIKYISYDPIYGNRIDDNGPIYMYTAHQVIPSRRSKTPSSSTYGSEYSSSGRSSAMNFEKLVLPKKRSTSQNSVHYSAGVDYQVRRSRNDLQFDTRKNLLKYLSRNDTKRDLSPLSTSADYRI